MSELYQAELDRLNKVVRALNRCIKYDINFDPIKVYDTNGDLLGVIEFRDHAQGYRFKVDS